MYLAKYIKAGPGGIKCGCCFPTANRRAAKKLFRAAKKRERREGIKTAQEV